jgi:hypothetical protein
MYVILCGFFAFCGDSGPLDPNIKKKLISIVSELLRKHQSPQNAGCLAKNAGRLCISLMAGSIGTTATSTTTTPSAATTAMLLLPPPAPGNSPAPLAVTAA